MPILIAQFLPEVIWKEKKKTQNSWSSFFERNNSEGEEKGTYTQYTYQVLLFSLHILNRSLHLIVTIIFLI